MGLEGDGEEVVDEWMDERRISSGRSEEFWEWTRHARRGHVISHGSIFYSSPSFSLFRRAFAANEFLEDEERDVEDATSDAIIRGSTEAHDQRPATCLTKRRGQPNHPRNYIHPPSTTYRRIPNITHYEPPFSSPQTDIFILFIDIPTAVAPSPTQTVPIASPHPSRD